MVGLDSVSSLGGLAQSSDTGLESAVRNFSGRIVPDELAVLRRCKEIADYTNIETGKPVWSAAHFGVNRANNHQYFHHEGEFAPYEVLDYAIDKSSTRKHPSQARMVQGIMRVHGEEVVEQYVRDNASEDIAGYLLATPGETKKTRSEVEAPVVVEPPVAEEPVLEAEPIEDEPDDASNGRIMVPMGEVMSVGRFVVPQRTVGMIVASSGVHYERGNGAGVSSVDVAGLVSHLYGKGLYADATARLAETYLPE